ncbi:hypothetical protein [Streptomyces sp. G45]|uniref:hypothetical protein n=1 Tax=Streptomyces sp. G45 TaxID=3406627 RepID=UPI003C21E713
MTVLTVVLLLILFVFGFQQPLLWVLAGVIVYLMVRRHDRRPAEYGPLGGTSAKAPGVGGAPTSYHEYKVRRKRQERWERRYRRTHPK